MDPIVIGRRQAILRSARRPPIPDRLAYLLELAEGRRVLDLGVVDHTSQSDRRDHWLHGQLAKVAGTILGIDIIENEVELLRQRGFAVECMDVTAGELPEGEWDLIVAGELVEHLACPGGLFDAAASLLAENGRFILSSPNPYALWRVVQNLRNRPYENADHSLLLSPWGIVELAERAGLRLRSFRGIGSRPEGWKALLVDSAVRHRLLPLVPETTCESLIYEVARS
jgi:2-polyprenyl-3-methyl-5-hydroxy-6-metoxy-1,4-benzoquinol methylase